MVYKLSSTIQNRLVRIVFTKFSVYVSYLSPAYAWSSVNATWREYTYSFRTYMYCMYDYKTLKIYIYIYIIFF